MQAAQGPRHHHFRAVCSLRADPESEPHFAGDEDDYANNNIANIPTSLQNCASPGFFYTANTPADITSALNAMFNHALVTAHITN